MTITLITGANKGLGYETARRLIDLGHTLLAGARDPQRGTRAARELGATFIHIDPTDDGSVEAAAARVRNEYANVSSGVGSFQRILEPGTVENAVTLPVYPATKAALTMLTVQYARALHGILVNAADPGFNNHRGTQTVTEGTDAIVHLATLPPGGPTGTFQDRHGLVPW